MATKTAKKRRTKTAKKRGSTAAKKRRTTRSASVKAKKKSSRAKASKTATKRSKRARKSAGAATSRRRKTRRSASSPLMTVRHYCQGIGDCHLLSLKKEDGSDFRILIDCGVHSSVKGGSQKISEIVADIAAETNNRIDVLVVTHEHWDHVSGFLTEAEQFKAFSIGEVWMAWTENPADRQARELDKFKQQALDALQMASSAFAQTEIALSPYSLRLRESLDAVLGFSFGAKGEKVRSARDAAASLVASDPRYFEPGSTIPIPDLPDLQIYVLGPPRDEKLLGLTEQVSDMYGFGGRTGWPTALALENAAHLQVDENTSEEDWWAPFDRSVGTSLAGTIAATADGADLDDLDKRLVNFVREHYASTPKPAKGHDGKDIDTQRTIGDQSWRRIDLDWLGMSADLALQLDSRTNNTSLVLAFEFKQSKKVVLFAADAQIGNWQSWKSLSWPLDEKGEKTMSADGLLARTVYYKVGHHGSHNATAKSGLELMQSPHLSAFIPTNEADAKKVRWGQMPFPGILDRLAELCDDRVIRADDPWIATDTPAPGFRPPSGSIRGLRHGRGLYVELDLG